MRANHNTSKKMEAGGVELINTNLLRVILLFIICNFGNLGQAITVLAASETASANDPADTELQRGWIAFHNGNIDKAIPNWLKAIQLYQDAGKVSQQVEVLTYLAQAYQVLGQYKNSSKSLALALVLSERTGDPTQIALVNGSLGNLYLATGPMEKAHQYLDEGLSLARQANNQSLTAAILNNLGNLLAFQRRYQESVEAYLESAKIGKETANDILAAKALTNAAMALLQDGQHERAAELLSNALDITRRLPPSQEKVHALISAGLVLSELSDRTEGMKDSFLRDAGRVLNESLSVAQNLGDSRSESYALGYLGHLYEREKRYEEALQLTRNAIFAAQQVNAPESLYRWEWQRGRLLKALGRIDDAISAYRRAVQTLQPMRQEMLVSYGNPRESFRDSIGPVYFKLVDLLLSHPTVLQKQGGFDTLLLEARDTVELFKAAELRDYFRDDCVDAARASVTKLDIVTPRAVVIYPIILPDRLELLVKLPSELKKFEVPVKADNLTQEVREFRRLLEKRTTNEYLPHAQTLYDWLIRPLEPDLNSVELDALVFVPDGPLRTIPMAALHDRKEFLTAKYPLAMTPGLDLTDPRPFKREKVNVLAVGLTEAVQGYPALPFVAGEIEAIQHLYGGQRLLNQEYVASRVETQLKENQFTVVHVASHGEFSSDSEKTFLLTFDDKITMDRLNQYVGLFRFRDDPLELLTLSACETAAGDDRAALGLAGIAVKAGARSALATLWSINDQAASILIAEFYQELRNPNTSRAVALQRAQAKLINDKRYQHPAYWSPFLLINNWL